MNPSFITSSLIGWSDPTQRIISFLFDPSVNFRFSQMSFHPKYFHSPRLLSPRLLLLGNQAKDLFVEASGRDGSRTFDRQTLGELSDRQLVTGRAAVGQGGSHVTTTW